MATNLDMLAGLKDAIFVDEILTKTRDGGLPWVKVAGNRYTVTVCEPPFCLSPYQEGWSWALHVTKLKLGDNYITSLDVLANDEPYIQSDSRLDANVDVLLSQIERVIAQQTNLNRGITFISKIDKADLIMCGGVRVGGNAKVSAIYNPPIVPAGVSSDGQPGPFVQMFVTPSGGATVNGTPDLQASFSPQTSPAGASVGGSATVSVG